MSRMKENGVDDQGHEGLGLLGIPAPVSSPGIIGPDCAPNNSHGQQQKARNDGLVEVTVVFFMAQGKGK